MEGTATFVRKLQGYRGDARLFRLDPPLEGNTHVVVSAANVMFSGPETYIFASDLDGNVLDWMDLDGSFRGERDHEKALRYAGYSTIEYPSSKGENT